ncbi:MAG: M3 family metallopeptidase, partial [Gemmatimonadota bacterium]
MAKPFALPATAEAFAQASWADIEPFYGELAARPISLDTVEAWLADWSRLEELLSEAAARAMIAYTVDTESAEREADHLRFSTEVLPKADEEGVRLARRLLELGYTRADLASMIERFRTQIEIFREANVPLSAQLEELSARYQKITGGMTVQWEGREVTLPQLQPHLKSVDRTVREKAFRLLAQPFLEQHQELAALFSRMYQSRQRMAANAGFSNYRDYAFRSKFRFDYTPEDVDRFHQAVEAVVSPAVERLRKKRRERLQLPTLRPWDIQVDPDGKPALTPFRDVGDLERTTQQVMQRLDPVLGRQFETMMKERLLDLDTRKGKAPGGYCETLHESGRPFIFMNAAGTFDDVMTLCHEAGHAFHAFAAHHLRFIWQR